MCVSKRAISLVQCYFFVTGFGVIVYHNFPYHALLENIRVGMFLGAHEVIFKLASHGAMARGKWAPRMTNYRIADR